MYWNNPLEQVQYPAASDIIFKATHGGQHCLFWNPQARFDHLPTSQRLSDLCAWANHGLRTQGVHAFLTNSRCFYDIANLVKLNMWIHDIRRQGIIKPWLIQDLADKGFGLGTGDSRLRCLERIPEIRTVPAFISTHVNRAHLYHDLAPVQSFDQFATLCCAEPGQEFLFRLTEPTALYGIDWYEYNSPHTRSVTPGEDQAVNMISGYLAVHPEVIFTPEWFDQVIDWSQYQECL